MVAMTGERKGKRMKKKTMVVLLCMMAVLAAGCGNTKTQELTSETAAAEEEPVEKAELPALTEDGEGEETHYAPANLTCAIPKGFVDNGDNEGLYVHKSYPTDISTISHVISDEGEDISTWSVDEFKEKLEQDYDDAYGDVVEIEILQSDKLKVDGRPGYRILMQFEFKGVVYEQLMYAFFNGNEVHYVYYTQEQGGKWMDQFVESGNSIRFEDIT